MDFDSIESEYKDGDRSRKSCRILIRLSPFPFSALPIFPSSKSPTCHITPQNISISYHMLPTFHLNNFKPWAPSHRKPFSPRKSLNPCTPPTQKPPRTKPYQTSLPSTLPLPKHHLPARPPAEVCMHTITNAQPRTLSTPELQPRQSKPQPSTYSENSNHGTASPHDSASHISDPNRAPRCELQDDTNIPVEPPAFRGDFAEDGLSSPSVSSADESLEEFFRLPDAQYDIPIDPVILANHGLCEGSTLQQSVPQADHHLINSEMACPYPDLPPVLRSPLDLDRDSSGGACGQHGDIETSDRPHIHGHQLHPLSQSQHGTSSDAPYPNNARGNPNVGGRSKGSKRKTRQSDGPVRKRLRVPSTLPSGKSSFTAIRSHFLSLPLGDRLQFLSWLFEGAVPRCMSDSSPAACEDGCVLETDRLSPPHEIEQIRRDCQEDRGSSRRGMPWSTEEADLLLKLRKVENRPWSEVARLFSEQYPGRSAGAIQVFWCTTLSKKAE